MNDGNWAVTEGGLAMSLGVATLQTMLASGKLDQKELRDILLKVLASVPAAAKETVRQQLAASFPEVALGDGSGTRL